MPYNGDESVQMACLIMEMRVYTYLTGLPYNGDESVHLLNGLPYNEDESVHLPNWPAL